MIRTTALFAASLVFVTAAQTADNPKEVPIALEKKLLGAWQGPACGGDYTFNADGTFEVKHFTPGNNTLTGAWSIRWDALPPTLVLTCKTSDFKKKDPSRPEYEFLAKALELRLLQLDSEHLAYQRTGGQPVSFARVSKGK
jgi:hypothetical protein